MNEASVFRQLLAIRIQNVIEWVIVISDGRLFRASNSNLIRSQSMSVNMLIILSLCIAFFSLTSNIKLNLFFFLYFSGSKNSERWWWDSWLEWRYWQRYPSYWCRFHHQQLACACQNIHNHHTAIPITVSNENALSESLWSIATDTKCTSV